MTLIEAHRFGGFPFYALIPGLPIESLPERFGGKVTPQADDCWEWTGSLTDDGYGRVWRDGRVARAHRVAYELLVGPIEPGLELDHLCRNKACVNPGHLEPVTPAENLRRAGLTFTGRTHCLRGEHELTPENVYVKPGTGHRECRSCRRRHNERSRARAAAKASPTPGSQVAGTPCPAATSPTPAPVVAADEPAPSRESGT